MKKIALRSFVAVMVFVACSSEPPPPPAPIVKKKKEEDKKALPAKTQVSEDFVYSPVGKRDPFRPFYVDLDEEEEAKSKRELTELQHFEMDQLRLVAIVGGTSQPMAMFEDPTGKGHEVTTGTPIGRNGGRVNKISKDEVVIMEELPDATGRKKPSPLTIRLPDPFAMEAGSK